MSSKKCNGINEEIEGTDTTPKQLFVDLMVDDDEWPKKKIPEELIAKSIINSYNIRYYNLDFYRFDGNQYLKGAEPFIKHKIQEHFDSFRREYYQNKIKIINKVTNNYVKEVIGYMERTCYVLDEETEGTKYYLGTKNRIVNVITQDVIPPTPILFIPRSIPVCHNMMKDCPEIDKFIRQLVPEEWVQTIYEIIGYCLYEGYPFKKIIIFYGPKADNGKTTLCKLIKRFLGKYNVSNISLYEFRKNFRPVLIAGKLANIYSELPYSFLGEENIGWLKVLTGGEDGFTLEKKYKDAADGFVNTATIIFSSNYLPSLTKQQIKDKSLVKRFVIIPFDNVFPPDDTILERLTTEDELSGLLNKSLDALNNLLTKKRFSKETTFLENAAYLQKYEHANDDPRRKDDEDIIRL